ncbi:MAG: hypothetical protein MUF54_06685, partial [Polyangiaceae bacterium]|nr:hypothetical protein [Polyangiaceae bacterium]
LDNRVGSLTYRQLSVTNVDDRDNPFVAASVELSRPIVDFTKTHTAGIQLVNDWSRPVELRAVPLSNADAELPAAYSVLPFEGAERVFPSGRDVVVLSHEWLDGQQVTRLTSVDYSDPRNPVRRGEIKVETNGALYGYGATGEATQSEVMQVDANLFVLAQDNGKERNFELVSFANPWKPEILSTAGVPAQGEVVEVRLVGSDIYLTTFEPSQKSAIEEPVNEEPVTEEPVIDPAVDPAVEPSEGSAVERDSMWMPPFHRSVETGKHFLTRIAFDGVRLAPSVPVNVPGALVDVDASGRLITLDQRVPVDGVTEIDRALDTLHVNFATGTAKLKGLLDVDDGVITAMLRGSSVYYTTTEQETGFCPRFRCGWWMHGDSNWTLHTVRVRDYRMTEAGSLLLQKNGSGNLLDIQQVGGSRHGFLTFGMGGFGLLNLNDANAPKLSAFMPWNGWASEVLVDATRREATLWLGDSGVRTIPLP